VSIFRAQQVTIEPGKDISRLVGEIIRANVSAGMELNFRIRDVTAPTSDPVGTPRSGTALIYFHDDVPEKFKALIKSTVSSYMTNGKNDRLERSMEVDANFIGLTQLHEPALGDRVDADILAIHGLNGHPCGSWLSKTKKPAMWLHDFLPHDIPGCRILLYGYKSNIFEEKEHLRHDLAIQSERLNATLNNARNTHETRTRPIIFIAHSYGGLILARVCFLFLYTLPGFNPALSAFCLPQPRHPSSPSADCPTDPHRGIGQPQTSTRRHSRPLSDGMPHAQLLRG
jgi:hypothetical protein